MTIRKVLSDPNSIFEKEVKVNGDGKGKNFLALTVSPLKEQESLRPRGAVVILRDMTIIRELEQKIIVSEKFAALGRNTLTTDAVIARRKYSARRARMRNCSFTRICSGLEITGNSRVRLRPRSITRPKRLVIERMSRPIPEISTTGPIAICKTGISSVMVKVPRRISF